MLLTILYLYTQPINKSTVAFPIRLYYIFTTKVIVKKLNNMLLKALVITPLTVATILRLGNNTSIVKDTNS